MLLKHEELWRRGSAVVLLLVVWMAACRSTITPSTTQSTVVGSWYGKYSLNHLSITFDADHKFSLIPEALDPKSEALSGSWSRCGNKLNLWFTADRSLVTWNYDGTSITVLGDWIAAGTVLTKKAESPK